MFLKFNLSVKKLVAFVLTSLFFMQQTMILPAIAESNISGVANGQSGSFDIHPDIANGDFGFKHYGNFELGKGDVANLIFALKNGDISVDKFVNLVDNRIIINGVLNGILKNGDIGGHAIFVSPNGMAVGASGVINVGSLTAIAPTQQAYTKYMVDSAIGSALPEGYTHENNLAVLKASDMGSDITVNGKIIARGDVNLVAQTVNIGNTADNKAGILAGVDNAAETNAGQKVNERLATTEAAGKLFDALVNNKVQSGTGFTKDANGNIVIQAQSIKTVVAPTLGEKLLIAGHEFVLNNLSGPLVDEYGNVLDTNLLPKELRDLGITSENVQSALETYVRDSIPSDATNPNAHNDTNFAKVDINNAVLKGNNVDISATSKADYIAQKNGTTLFDSAYSSAIGQIIEGAVTGEGFDFEGARAKAEVVIGSGADIIADNDVNINSLAVANTSIKTGTRYTPVIDSGQEYYYTLGSKTISTINVNDGAKITAGNDVNIHAQSQNSHNIKLKNPTSAAGQLVGGYTGIPTIQVLLLKSTLDAQTSALVNSGAIINAANVEVDAVNVSSDLSNINSIASIGKDNGGIAVAVTLKDTNINTTAKIDTTVNTNGDGNVSVNAQNLHMASNTSQATVDPKDPKLRMGDKFKFKILNLIADKLSGVIDTNILGSVSDLVPNVSTALVVNDSNITTTAKIGANANIHADNVSVNANTVDLTVNTTKAHVKDGDSKASGSGSSGGVGDYIPNPGVAVIVNNQNNNTTAVIEDGTAQNHANVTADNKLSVNATTELPRNNATFDLILNVIQAAGDIEDLPEDIKGNVNAELGKGDQWDIRLLLQGLTNPAAEIGSEISDIKFGIKNGGIKNNLGLQGFFNNWAETTSSTGSGIGIAASVIVSDVVNNTVARIGDNSVINAGDVIVNAANQVVQYNAAGDVAKLWKLTDGASGKKSGVGGNVVVESVESNARAQVGDGAVINVTENAIGSTQNKTKGELNIQAANQQDFLTAVVTGSKATGNNGVAISGSVTVQNVTGATEASLGASKVNASTLNIKAGEAQLATAQNSEGYLFHESVPKKDEDGNIVYDEYGDPVYEESNPFEDLNAEDYEVGLDPDLTSPQISNYMGVDSDTGLLVLNEASTIKDGISNILIAGAIASESAKVSGSEGSGTSSSSGGAVGASVNVSQFDRDVKASIADGAVVNLTKDLNVISDSYTQSIDVAIAGAFAGGVKLSKKEDKKDTDSSFAGNKLAESNPLFSKVSGLFDKVSGKLGSTEAPVGSDANPDVNVNGNSYKADADGVYKDANGNNLTASDGNSKNDVKFQGSTGKEAANLDNLSSKNGQSKNISVAAAGSVNVQLNESSVTSEVGNAQITVGKDVNVKANQTTKSLNIGGGIAKAATVGAGAAVNFVENINETKASLKGTDITFNGSDNKLNVKAEENNDNVQVAIGVGVAKASQDDTTTQVSAGGSFNTDILENKVNAQIDGAKVKHESGADTIAVDVNAENHSTSYKGAGGMSVNTGSSGTGTGTGVGAGGSTGSTGSTGATGAQSGNTSVGAGMGGNLNLITKETTAKITNSEINNTKSVSVAANKDNTQKTEDLISVGVGGSVITDASSGYSFSGAMATDVINNTINAQIDNSTVNSTGNVDVVANNNFNNRNLAGALSFSSASKGAGVGAGAIVSVINNNVNASIANNSTITAKDVNVNADNNENLQFLAANMGIQAGAGIPISANGIVNVIQNDISASVSDSDITNSGTLDIISDYDTSIEGITVGVAATSEGKFSVGANVLSNMLLSSNTAQLINSDTTSTDKLTLKATTDGNIDAIPAAAAITASGSAAAAANVGVNVVQNSTTAKIDGTNNKNTVSANGIDVIASDNTKSRSRGGVLAASGGTVAVGGSILADVYIKNVDAHIDNTIVTKGGNIKVDASAKNIFGEETPGSVTASALVDKITGDYDMSNDTDYQNWDMTFDVAGASTAGVSGSLISKNVINDVDSYIGSNVVIQEAGNIDVLASNKTVADVIVGSITAAATAAVGGSVFSNVNVSTVDAGIKNGAQIGGAQIGNDASRVGDVNIEANSEQTYKSIMAIVGAAGNAAVKGSVNSNIIVNETNSYVGNGVNMYSDSLNVAASDSMDVEAINVAVAAAGTAAATDAIFVNVLANKVNSTVGKDATGGQQASNINTNEDVKVSANDLQDFQANVLLTSAAGSAGVGLVGIANVMASEVNAGIENTTVTSNNGSITVSANNSFNGTHKNQNTGLQDLINNGSVSSDDVSELIPLVGVITVSAAGGAGVGATLIANVVTTSVNAYVDKSTISTKNGLDVNANSSMTTYDAALSILGAGAAAVGVNGVTNVYSGSTIAAVTNSEIENGSLKVASNDEFNLNTIIFSIAAASAASVNAITNVNTISNEVTAKVEDTNILNAQTVEVDAHNTVKTTDVLAAAAVAGTGAGVNVAPIVNVFINDTNAYIQGGSIANAETTVDAGSDIAVTSAILGVSGSGIGAAVSGFAGVNVFDNDLNAYILETEITNAISTSVASTANLDLDGILVSAGVNGLGAAVNANGIINVIKNNVNAYIADSSITGGSVTVSATQTSDIDNSTSTVAVNGVGAAVPVNALVSVLTNNLNANITNTSVDADSVSVSANSKQDILNNNIGVGASGTAGGGVNTTVNVLENTAKAYIDAQDKTVKASGKVSVAAKDEILMQTNLGLASVSGFGAVGANVNVNVINNAVLAQLLSSENGQINAGSVEVKSDSIIGLDEAGITAAAAGTLGIAGTVFVNSIGGKVSDYSSDSNLKDAGIDDSITQANTNFGEIVNGITYEKDGQTQYLAGSYDLTQGDVKGGTQADINANVNTRGADGVKVSANNTLKGYDSDTMNITNATASAGTVAAGVGVLVTDMKYNTSASISGGNVTAQNGKVSVEANSNVKSNTNAVAATAGGVAIGGNVAYFNNNADTAAQITGGKISTDGDIKISAVSDENIITDAIAEMLSGISVNVAVALAQTQNSTIAQVAGDDILINGNNMDILATTNSTLSSQLQSYGVTGANVNVIVNNAISESDTTASVTGNENTKLSLNGALTMASQTAGVNVTDNVVLGSISAIGVNTVVQSAKANSDFNTTIKGANVEANNVNLLAGTKAQKEGNSYKATTQAGDVNAKVSAKKASMELVGGNATIMKADVNASTKIAIDTNASVTATGNNNDGKVSLLSNINKTATSDSDSNSLSGVSIGGVSVTTNVNGESFINTEGSQISADTFSAKIENNNKAVTNLIAGSIAFIEAAINTSKANVSANSKLTTGDINADNIELNIDSTKTADISQQSFAAGIASIGASTMETNITGESGVKTTGTVRNRSGNDAVNSFVVDVDDDSTAQNTTNTARYGALSVETVNIKNTVASTVANEIGCDIQANSFDFESNLNRTAVTSGDIDAAGLGAISSINVQSQIGGATENEATGSVTNITADISKSSGNIKISSNANNTAKVYLAENTAGLIAIAKGSSKNVSHSKNEININKANIDVAGNLAIDAANNNTVAMTKKSSGGGFISVKGGTLSNDITSSADINVTDSNISANNIDLTSASKLATEGSISYDDSADGFITSNGATVNNNIKQSNNVKFVNSKLTAQRDLKIAQKSDSDFRQEVKSTHSGFAVYNKATSNLSVTNNNNVSFDKNTDIAANDVSIRMDSNNNLSSKTHTEARHFAGSPSSNANLTLNVNNTFENSGKITSKGSTNVNFLSNSVNNLTQDAYLYAEAAVATGSVGGAINYNVNNKMDVKSTGIIASDKDVIIDFASGNNNFNANNYSKKVSRLLFGIPITVSDSSSTINQTKSGSLVLDGEISAGIGSDKYMKIDQNGNVVTEELKGFTQNDYEVQNVSEKTSQEVTQEALEALQAQKNYLEQQIEDIDSDTADYQQKIAEYTQQIAEIDETIKYYNTGNTITQEEANAAIETAIKNKIDALTGEHGYDFSESDYNAIKQLQEAKIAAAEAKYKEDNNLENYTKAVDSSLEDALNEFKYEVSYESEPDKDGNTTTITEQLGLSNDLKNSIKNAISEQQGLYKEDINGVASYNGSLIISDAQKQEVLSNLKEQKESIAQKQQELNGKISELNNQKTSFNEQISDINERYEYLSKPENALPGVNITKPQIVFDDISTDHGKIQITGIEEKDVTGTGKFKVYQPSLVIDNYSDRNLIFGSVDVSKNSTNALTIDGKDFSSYLDSGKKINNTVAYVTSDSNNGYQNGIYINNWFDHNNPSDFVSGKTPSDIVFNGKVTAGGKLKLFNDSGDIEFKDAISAGNVLINAVQGSIDYDAASTDFVLNQNDKFIAGKDVNITAQNIKIDGSIQAGRDVRSVTITDDMLQNLVVDPSTGKKNMIPIDSSDNIKALYIDGKIVLFNIYQEEGGNVKLTGKVSGNGNITYTNGYSSITVNNETNKELVVNNFTNNRINGEFVATEGTFANVNKLGKESASTNITSNGKVSIKGVVSNGNGFVEGDKLSTLNVSSKNGIVVTKQQNPQDATIISTGNTKLENTASDVLVEGIMKNTGGDTVITNSGDGSVQIAGSINNTEGNTEITNNGTEGILISGIVDNEIGNTIVTNTTGRVDISGTVTNASGKTDITNSGDGGVKVSGTVKNDGGDLNVSNNNQNASAVTTTAGSLIENNNGALNLTNEGAQGISHAGTIHNIKGVTNIVNNNTSDTSAIKIATTANVTNDDGSIYIKNYGTKEIGLDIEGIVNAIKQNIEITNENSDIEIGEYDSNNDFYVNAQNGNIIISQKNGDILNGVADPDTKNKNQNHDLGNKDKAYKTLLTAGGNLSMNVDGGNIGADTHALNGKESGFGVNASTRDYTESINVKVNGTVNAKATNNGNALVNIRAKDSDLKVNNITSDGNVMLTAVDWKQADARPTPSDESYYHGYSIVNAASDKSKANVEGRNISLISSDNLGAKGNAFTYNQLENGSISAMAENDLYIKGMGQNDNLWQLITKRGNMGLEFTGNAIIRELTAGKHLEIVSQGANLTIYDLGKATNLADTDDILYPHDNILMSSVAPETVDIRVLDTNPDTRVNPNDANSTLNIYNAYIKGQSNGSADVTLRADNIIAHAYDAASSPVSNVARPNGFDATEGRLYANDYMNPDADKNLKATGFNTVGKGGKLVFDIQGVSPDDVVNAGGKESDRNYKPQEVIETWEIFNNPIGFKDTVYKAKDVTLSLNSGANAPTDNRGMEISKIYTDNAYVDTKDLNMHISDAFITNYGEFRNGNLGGQGGGHFISDEYRWLTIVDNDYYRNITNNFGIPVTSQLYTKLTGSFALNMGNVIALETKAPVVHYNPYEVILLPRTENSFYRLTYKDDKIQKTTTTPDFADIDKSTYKPTKRDSIRFAVKQGDGYVNIADKKKKKQERKRIIAIENISRGGLAVVHDGSLKKGERFVIDLDYHNIKASPEVEVVRVVNDRAGLKFINMDKATANKILYMNMFTAEAEDQSPQMSKK